MQIRNLKVAVCKPDHLGDLVLALPALRKLQAEGCHLTLFIASGNFGLARFLVPDADLVALDMPYLKRDASEGSWSKVYKAIGQLRGFDLVFFLRRDSFFTLEHFAQWSDYSFFIEQREDKHQTLLEHSAVAQVCGGYDIENLFFQGRSVSFPSDPRKVAFAVGAGFPHKKWSPLAWSGLGHRLRDRGIAVKILSGPGEIEECRLIARSIGLRDGDDLFVGGADFKALGAWLDTVDCVVAADGGSAHLCSLYKPVVGVFGPSPFRRYAPTGSSNRVVTRNLPCSPCVGFDVSALNACLSRECLYSLPPQDVETSIFMPSLMPGEVFGLQSQQGTKVFFGVSSGRPPAMS